MGMLMHRHFAGDNTPAKVVREEKPKEETEVVEQPKAKSKKATKK